MSPTANHPSFTDTMPNHHLTPTLHPCAPIPSPSTTMASSPGPFHLLHCGHIVLITHPDRRCARNCLYAVSWANEYISNSTSPLTNTHPYPLFPFSSDSFSSVEPFNSVETPSTDELSSPHPPTTLYTPLPPLSTTQSHDLLHCEVCHGIPFDTFERLKLDLTNMETFQQRRTMRRALGLTRAVLQAELLLAGDDEEEVVERMMCQPLRYGGRREGEEEEGGWSRHLLRCGHGVWCGERGCAVNCGEGEECVGSLGERRGDAVVCGECVFRAEGVGRRFARGEGG